MANPFFSHIAPFQSSTTVRADGVNAKFDAVETAFDVVNDNVNRQLRVHPDSNYGSLEIPNVTLTNGMLYFDESGNVTVFSKDAFDTGINQAAASASQSAISATASSDSATQSGDSATQSEANKNLALTHANSAASYASNAQTQVSLAQDEVVNAQTEVSNAQAEVANAQTKVDDANTAATTATNKATLAGQYANHAEDIKVPATNDYSAYHWYKKAEAIVTADWSDTYLTVNATAANSTKLGDIHYTDFYHTSNKPTKSDVGLSSVPNAVPFYTGNLPSWSQVSSKPSTFIPSSHSHDWSDLTNIPSTASRFNTEVIVDPGTGMKTKSFEFTKYRFTAQSGTTTITLDSSTFAIGDEVEFKKLSADTVLNISITDSHTGLAPDGTTDNYYTLSESTGTVLLTKKSSSQWAVFVSP